MTTISDTAERKFDLPLNTSNLSADDKKRKAIEQAIQDNDLETIQPLTEPTRVNLKELLTVDLLSQVFKSEHESIINHFLSLVQIANEVQALDGTELFSKAAYKVALQYKAAKAFEKAFKWCQKSAQNGYIKAEYMIGWLYYMGQGVEKSPQKAFTWCKKAAQSELPIAQHILACFYLKGVGVQRSEDKALYWYLGAAEKGYMPSQYALGKLYAGQGRESEAILWLQKAAEKNHTAAKQLLEKLNPTPCWCVIL